VKADFAGVMSSLAPVWAEKYSVCLLERLEFKILYYHHFGRRYEVDEGLRDIW